jgi:lysophospholipase
MVVVVHGYFDHVGLFGNLIRYLLEQGYGVVAFDLPGHGLSSGEPASIETFDHYVEVFDDICAKLRQKFPVPISAIGQSTGGAIILKYLAADNTGLEKVCVLSPLVEPALWWLNKIVYLLSHRFRKSVKRAFRSNSADNEFLAFLKNNDPLQARTIPLAWLGAMKGWIEESHAMAPNNYPVTIIQGDRDTTVRWRKNLKILAKKFPAAKIIKIAGAHHHLVNEVQPLRDRIYQQMGF